MFDAIGLDQERYSGWFSWARAVLGRGLDATHAAAQAASACEAAGGSHEEAQAAAQVGGSEPAGLDVETMAIAEWASWAGTRFGATPAASLIAARHAVARVTQTHDLDGVIREVSDVMAAQRRSPTSTRNRGRDLWSIGGVAAAVVVVCLVTLGLVLANQPAAVSGGKTGPAGPAEITVSVDPASGDSTVTAWGLPPDTPTFLVVGDEIVRIVQTDAKGHFQTNITLPSGTSRVAVCVDSFRQSCPASTVVKRP